MMGQAFLKASDASHDIGSFGVDETSGQVS